ncbi:MAG: metal ABC transporter permease [Polyangiaceae bacterium]
MSSFYAWLAALARSGKLPHAFEYPFITRGILAAILLAPLLGGLSHVVVARRMAFFSSVIGHGALTGLTLGLLLGASPDTPWLGMMGFCVMLGIGISYVKRRSPLSPDTLIGVFMALTLGLGVCLLVAATKTFNIHQIEGLMFGSLLTVTDLDLLVLLVGSVVIGALVAWRYNALLLDSLDTRLASTARVDTTFIEYAFVVLLTAAIVVSLKIVGALLVEALVVVPAAAARNVARTARGYWLGSIAIALVSGVAGIFVSSAWAVPTGGAVVLTLSAAFFVTLALRRFVRSG